MTFGTDEDPGHIGDLKQLAAKLVTLIDDDNRAEARQDLAGPGAEWDRLSATVARLQASVLRRENALRERSFQLELVLDILRKRDREAAEQAEWDFATDLQRSMLPQDFPAFPDRHEFDIHAGMVTAKEVGGDLYDFFLLSPDRLGFVVADAAGKGLPAAIFITLTQTLLRAASKRLDDPGHCLATVNQMLCIDNPTAMFATAFYGILETDTGIVHYANAGHNPPLILHADGSVEELPPSDSMALGVFEEVDYPARAFKLEKGDTIVCFSDGVTEAMNAQDDLFGDERLADVLRGAAGQDPAGVLFSVIAEVDAYMGLAPMADDVTLLVLRYAG